MLLPDIFTSTAVPKGTVMLLCTPPSEALIYSLEDLCAWYSAHPNRIATIHNVGEANLEAREASG